MNAEIRAMFKADTGNSANRWPESYQKWLEKKLVVTSQDTPHPSFWKRLKTFVEAVQVNDPMSLEEKEMILNTYKKFDV